MKTWFIGPRERRHSGNALEAHSCYLDFWLSEWCCYVKRRNFKENTQNPVDGKCLTASLRRSRHVVVRDFLWRGTEVTISKLETSERAWLSWSLYSRCDNRLPRLFRIIGYCFPLLIHMGQMIQSEELLNVSPKTIKLRIRKWRTQEHKWCLYQYLLLKVRRLGEKTSILQKNSWHLSLDRVISKILGFVNLAL